MDTLRKAAQAANKKLVYIRTTGMYHIISAFVRSDGQMPFRNEKGRLELTERQKHFLLECI